MIRLEVREYKVRFINSIYRPAVITEEVDRVIEFDRATQERRAIGRICRCGTCECCKTKAECDALEPSIMRGVAQ